MFYIYLLKINFHFPFCLFFVTSTLRPLHSTTRSKFRVCESLKALTLQLMSPCCFNFKTTTWRKEGVKMKSKLELQIANCKLYQLLLSFGLASLPFFYSFTSHQIPPFFVILWLSFFHFSPNPLCLHFFCDKLWVFNKFYIGSSSFVMNNTYLSPNEKMVLMFGGDDNSINVDNML